MVIFGTGIFVFMLSLIFCCYFIRWVAPWVTWGRESRRRRPGGRVGQVRFPQQSLTSHWGPCFEDRAQPVLPWAPEAWCFYFQQPLELFQSI